MLTAVSSLDQGLYSCKAANLHGELTESSELLILGKHREAGCPCGPHWGDCLTHPHLLLPLIQLNA